MDQTSTPEILSSVYAAGFVLYRTIPPENTIEYLLIQSNSGKFGVPKGHVEEGEEDYEAAIRETKEEVGLVEGNDFKILPEFKFNVSYEVNNIRDGNKKKSITLWLGKITNARNCVVKTLPEHQGYKWLELKEAVACIGRRPGYQSWVSCLEACNEKIISSDIYK